MKLDIGHWVQKYFPLGREVEHCEFILGKGAISGDDKCSKDKSRGVIQKLKK